MIFVFTETLQLVIHVFYIRIPLFLGQLAKHHHRTILANNINMISIEREKKKNGLELKTNACAEDIIGN